jgi:glycosyltransferase involved in cell wall biosynthesis
MSSKRNILIVTETITAGGAETFALRLARKMRQLGHGCDLLCLNPDFVDQRLLGAHAVEPIILSLPAVRWIKRFDRAAGMLGLEVGVQHWLSTRFVRKLLGGYDVVHTNLLGADLLFARLKRERPELRVVSTLHGDYALHEFEVASTAEGRRSRHWPKQKELLKSEIDAWAYISEDQRRLMTDRLGIEEGRLRRIYNGFELSPAAQDAPLKRADAALTFAMAARGTIPEKGWEWLIRAFLTLQGDVQLLLIGAGDYLSGLQQQFGTHPRIRFAGFHPDPAVLIAQADLFVLPTTYPAESLPTVIIEALSVGVPIIATDVGEIAAMLRTPAGEQAGLVLDPDQPSLIERLATAMQGCVDDPSRLEQLQKVTGEAFAKFDMTSCAEAYVRLYGEIIDRG